MKPRLLDLFCGAGGCSMGYHRAGFDVVGVDINPQKHYPFEFHQADAMTYPLDGFDVIHASPPCQRFSVCTPTKNKMDHPDLIDPVRQRLIQSGCHWIIENVPGAPLNTTVMLCGSMFGLRFFRHRDFECSLEVGLVPNCKHDFDPVMISGTPRNKRRGRKEYSADENRIAHDLGWMTRKEMDQAIPPAYTEWIGRQLMKQL